MCEVYYLKRADTKEKIASIVLCSCVMAGDGYLSEEIAPGCHIDKILY